MTLTYAIGDVHGRRDLLAALLAAIRDDAGARAARIVFLGDIIDRGPESRGALDLVIAALGEFPGSRLILGNHEEFLLRFVESDEERMAVASRWLANGGRATLSVYGMDESEPIDSLAERFARDFPAHVAALRAAEWKVETGTHIFVHAGIDPALPLARQDPRTTRWIRDEFLRYSGPLPKTVVHGHTVTDSFLPEIHGNRIALDTGAVISGHLTCAVFDGEAPPKFLATDDHGASIEVSEIRPLDCR